jgi:hypothetical protein
MKYQTTVLQEYGKIRVGMRRTEQEGKRTRTVVCKAIHLGIDGKYYAMWMYTLAKTGKVSNKSGAWLTEIQAN